MLPNAYNIKLLKFIVKYLLDMSKFIKHINSYQAKDAIFYCKVNIVIYLFFIFIWCHIITCKLLLNIMRDNFDRELAFNPRF